MIINGLLASENFEIALTLSSSNGEINGCIDFREDKPTSIIQEKGSFSSILHGKDFLDESEPILDLSHLPDDDAEIIELTLLIEEARCADIPYMATVYNIEVEDFHTYYVGKSGILVAAQK